MMFAEAPGQGLTQSWPFGAQATTGELSQRCGLTVTRRQLTQDLSARHAQNITHHTGELEVGILQYLVQTVGHSRMVMLELAAVAHEIAQLTDGRGGIKLGRNNPFSSNCTN